MDDEKVRRIFFKHLEDKDVNEAVAEAHREISESVLADTYSGQVVDKTVWELLLKIIRAMTRVNLLSPYFEEGENDTKHHFGSEFFADISFCFQTWRDVVDYVIANFDRLMSARVKTTYSVEHFEMVLRGLDQQLFEQTEKMVESGGHITLVRVEFSLMSMGLTWGLRSVMGAENYEKFREELNKHLVSLRMYYEKVASPPDAGSKPN